MTAILHDDTERARFEIEVEGQIVFADYRLQGDVLSILHVESPPALRGKGAAGTLMALIVALARARHWRIRPVCGYAAVWIQRHPDS